MFTAEGLCEAEAARLLREVGYNELPSAKPRSVLAIAQEAAKEPMFLLLVAGGLVYRDYEHTESCSMVGSGQRHRFSGIGHLCSFHKRDFRLCLSASH
ncbi:MAG: cation-transporting P-type ATPase [Methanothrix sp.]|nr:cation-transporting P-type ATPase [Methanothrix sp.]